MLSDNGTSSSFRLGGNAYWSDQIAECILELML
jgi:hypothetical protein